MAYQLRSDEILEALSRSKEPRAADYIKLVELATQSAAEYLAGLAGCKCGDGAFESLAFAGLCVPFHPAFKGQELPEIIAGFDNVEEWSDD